MHQGRTYARDRSGNSSELAGYGDLASFDRQAPSREQDEQDAINLIMGGEDFLVGDGTLEFKLRDEDRDLMPEIPTVSRAARAQRPEQAERDFVPIEHGFPDPGDEVARSAVTEALSRLESLAGDLVSEEAVAGDDEETAGELTEEGADDLLNTSGNGGMGSDLESDAPAPFALPKLPGSFEPYVPPVNEAILTSSDVEKDLPYSPPPRSASIPSETSFNPSRDAIRSFEDEAETAPVARSVKHVPVPVIESKTEEFAPFELRSDRSADVESFDTRTAEVPSYARTTEKKSGMPVVESDLDGFLPPAADAQRAAQTRPVEREVRAPAYSQPRTVIEARDVDTYLLEDAFANRDTDPEPPVSEAVEPEAAYQTSQAAAPAAAAPAMPTIFAKYRNLLLGLALGAVLICYKHFTQPSAESEPEVTSEGAPARTAPIEREYSRAPIEQALTGVMSPQTTLPAKVSPLESVLETPATEPKVNAPVGKTPALEAKVAELAEQMAAIQAERNKLREENAALKKKTAPATKPKKIVTVKAADVKAESAPAPVRKPVQNIQYLGTFHDGDRLVAEVLIDGNLARVKRGDAVVGNRRVDAVGDMSVTIDDVVYSP